MFAIRDRKYTTININRKQSSMMPVGEYSFEICDAKFVTVEQHSFQYKMLFALLTIVEIVRGEFRTLSCPKFYNMMITTPQHH